MARTEAVGETSTINPSQTRFAPQSQQAVAYLRASHSLRRPERTHQPPELVRAVGRSLGIFKMRRHA